MKDTRKTKAQLIAELEALRARCDRLESNRASTGPDKALLRSLVDQMLEPTVILDWEGNLLHGNGMAADVIGVDSADAIAGMSLASIMHPDSRTQAAADLLEVKNSEAAFFGTYKLLIDGKTMHIESHGTKIELTDGSVDLVSFRDVTARQEEEERQRATELMLKSVLDHSSQVIFVKDVEGRYLLINKRYEELFGVSSEAIKGKTDFDIFPHEAAERFRVKDRLALESRRPIEDEETVPHNDGDHTYISVKFPLFGDAGKAFATCGIATDITERKRIENDLIDAREALEARVRERTAALEESERKFRALADSTSAIILMAGEDGRIFYANKAAEETTGYTLAELSNFEAGKTLLDPTDMARMAEAIEKAKNRGEDFTAKIELKIRRKDGETRWLEASGRFIRLGDQLVDLSTSFDITERKRAEEALKESEKRFRALADSTTAQIVVVAGEGERFVYANRAALERAGMGWDEFAALNPGESLTPEAREAGMRAAEAAVARGENQWRFQYREGSAWYDVNVAGIEIDGEPAAIYTSFDITEHKLAQERVEIFEKFAETSVQGFGMSDLEGNITYVNPSVVRFTGLKSPDQGIGKHFTEFHPPEYHKQMVEEVVPQVLEHGEWTGEMPMQHVDGSTTPMILSMFLLRDEQGNPQRFAAVLTDITERRRAVRELEESEKKFRSLAESTTAHITIMQDDRYIYANQAFLDYYDIDEADLAYISVEDLGIGMLTPETEQAAMKAWQSAMARGDKQFRFEYPDTAGNWFQANVTMVELDGKESFMAMTFDITDLKLAQQALAAGEERYRTIFDTAGTGMISFGDDAIITLANEEWAKLSGYAIEEIIGKMTWARFFSEASLTKMKQYHKMRTVDPESVPTTYESQFLDRAGEIHDGIINIQVVPGTHQRVASFQDMTALKRAQNEMYRADKMAALGQIIAGVAHEINNPNNFIYFNLPILKRYIEAMLPMLEHHLEDDPDLKILNMPYEVFIEDVFKLLENMAHGSKRITGIVSELKTYVRSDDEAAVERGAVAPVIDRVMALVGKQVRKMVKRFDVKVASRLQPVNMNPGRIEQVLINMVINAGQAADKEDSWVTLTARPGIKAADKAWVEILVEDNGAGIPDDIRDQIFEPFFTSKGRDMGTGLGLSISQKIIEEHGGTIAVDSTPGEGTCFTIRLPADG